MKAAALPPMFGRHPDAPRTIGDEIAEMIRYYAYDDAILLAELNFENSKENRMEALLLYADALYRANKKEECYGLLRSEKLKGGHLFFLFARVAYDLNRIDECRGALFEHDNGILRQDIVDDRRVAAHANLLNAHMLCDDNHMDIAFDHCEKALEENILLWSAIITYLRFGGEDLNRIFRRHQEKSATGSPVAYIERIVRGSRSERSVTPAYGPLPSTSDTPAESTSSTRRSARSSVTTPATSSRVSSKAPTPVSGRARPAAPRKSSRISEMATRREPTSARQGLFTEPERPHTRATHSSRNRANAALNSDTENSAAMNTRNTRAGAAATRGATTAQRTQPVRTSTRIADAAQKAAKVANPRKRNEKQPLVPKNSNLARSLSGSTNSVASTASERPSEDDVATSAATTAASTAGLEEPMDVGNGIYDAQYKKFFDLYHHVALIEESVHQYDWKTSDSLFERLDKDTVLNTSLVRLQLGRACFEQSEYRECRTILEELYKRRTWKVEGTELLSTALWHLQDTHALSSLAQSLTTNSRERPQSWCAAGNCFSLQRQHNQAIECIERAIQIDKRFNYAHTLLGHELIVQDELERAAGSFRSALMLSPRDYRAWYGLGLVHLKKEQSNIALANIQKAVSINPTNRAMLCTLSQIEQQQGRVETALQLIDKALTLNPLDVACRFNRARLLFDVKRNEECLEELDKLKAGSPDEAFVFHLLARVHRRMGNTHMSLLNYSWAAELDPRGEQNVGDNGLAGREEYEDDEEYGTN